MDTILSEPPSARRYAGSPVYQFSEAATKLSIKNLFDAVITHVFIVHERSKLVF
jgi:hypothetical protein